MISTHGAVALYWAERRTKNEYRHGSISKKNWETEKPERSVADDILEGIVQRRIVDFGLTGKARAEMLKNRMEMSPYLREKRNSRFRAFYHRNKDNPGFREKDRKRQRDRYRNNPEVREKLKEYSRRYNRNHKKKE